MATSKEIDKTYLSIDNAEERGFIHRDYIAHCFRWSHVIKFLQQQHRFKDARILDLGCGKEAPLLKTMYTSKMAPYQYTGLDYNQININDCIEKAANKCVDGAVLLSNYDISIDRDGIINGRHNIITSFEVFEHMTPRKLMELLKRMMTGLTPGSDIFVSTPNFNGSAAANHHNEMTQEFLTELFEAFGFKIKEKYGTFASQKDYMNEIRKDGYENIFDRLCEYYDSNIVAVIFAPLYPNFSRNVMWHMTPHGLMDQEKIADVIEKYFDQQQDFDGWRNVMEELKGY